jgi:hypothetical protein
MTFILETALSIMLVRTLPLRKLEDATLQFNSVEHPSLVEVRAEEHSEAAQVVADSMEQALAKDFGSVPQVSYLLVEPLPEAFLVWIAVDNPEKSIRHRIYEKELALISEFPEVNFDFNLTPSHGESPEQIASMANVVYARKR